MLYEVKKENMSSEEKSMLYRDMYRVWKHLGLSQSGYFIIFQGFLENEILKKITGNALRLYIYLGSYANNYEGFVWHSNKKIANYFNKSERTIRGWMKELETLKLIKRVRMEYDGKVYTHLLPYNLNDNSLIKDEEGRLYFSDKKQLCFQGKYKSFVLKEEVYNISFIVGDNNTIDGYLIRKQDNDKEWYEFKSKLNNGVIKLEIIYEVYNKIMIPIILHNKLWWDLEEIDKNNSITVSILDLDK